MKSQVKLTS